MIRLYLKNNQDINLKLNVRTSGIVLFKKLSNVESELTNDVWKKLKDDYSKYKNLTEVDINPNISFNEKLKKLYDEVAKKYKPTTEDPKNSERDQLNNASEVISDGISDRLNSVTLELKHIEEIVGKTDEEKLRVRALKSALKNINKGNIPYNSDNLSNKYVNTAHKYQLSQKFIVDELIATWEKIEEKKRENFQKELKDKKSLFQAWDLVYNNYNDTEKAEFNKVKLKNK